MAYEDGPSSQQVGLEAQEPKANGNIAITTSESMGYAMLIAAYINDEDLFRDLAKFYSRFRSTTNGSSDLMCWQVHSYVHSYAEGAAEVSYNLGIPPDSSMFYVDADGKDSATDGDMDIAYAYLLANKQWGKVEDLTQAKAIMADILAYDIHQTKKHIKLGNASKDNDPSTVNGNSFNMGDVTRPSDFFLSHLKTFAAVDTANAADWNDIYDVTVGILTDSLAVHKDSDTGVSTGLLPDFMIYDSTSSSYIAVPYMVLETENDGNFVFNAPRYILRTGLDAALNNNGEVGTFNEALCDWLVHANGANAQSDADKFQAGYDMSGNVLADYGYSDRFVQAPVMMVAAVSGAGTLANTFYSNLIAQAMGSDVVAGTTVVSANYYGDTIKILSLITVADGWWDPAE